MCLLCGCSNTDITTPRCVCVYIEYIRGNETYLRQELPPFSGDHFNCFNDVLHRRLVHEIGEV